MCGGPSSQQKHAADSQSNLADTLSGIAKQRNSFQQPFLQSRVQGGLPFLKQYTDFNAGDLAHSYALNRNDLIRRLRGGPAANELPSGFATQSIGDLNAQQARDFDSQLKQGLLLDEQTRAAAAGMSNPLGYFTGAQQGYGNILSLPQQTNPLGSILGGALSGLIGLA